MAAPTIRGVTTPIITTAAINQPSATQVGDLVIFWLWSQAANSTTVTHTLQSGFITIRTAPHEDGTTDGRLSVAYRVADQAGTVSLTPYTVANATANQTAGGAVALTVGTFDVSSAPPNNGSSLTTNAIPNPPSLTGLTGDYRVFALSAWHTTTSAAHAATAMANYAIDTQMAASAHVTHLAIASRALTGLSNATEDPAAWASDNLTPNGSISFTFAISGALAPISGTASITDAADSRSGAGAVAVAGTGSTTDGDDVQSAAGDVDVAGAASVNDSADGIAAAGTVEDNPGVSGDAAIVDAADATGANGAVSVAGSAAATDGADASSAGGAVAIVGGAARVDAGDSASSSGDVAITANGTAVDAADGGTRAGGVAVNGAAAVVDGADALTASDGGQQTAAPTNGHWHCRESKRRQMLGHRRRR
jgi:colicin import membrane protein